MPERRYPDGCLVFWMMCMFVCFPLRDLSYHMLRLECEISVVTRAVLYNHWWMAAHCFQTGHRDWGEFEFNWILNDYTERCEHETCVSSLYEPNSIRARFSALFSFANGWRVLLTTIHRFNWQFPRSIFASINATATMTHAWPHNWP